MQRSEGPRYLPADIIAVDVRRILSSKVLEVR